MTETSKIIYDPYRLMDTTIGKIEATLGEIVDPGTPFVLAIESAALMASAAVGEMVQTYRQLYPTLAEERSHLFNHISNENELNSFAVPSEAKIQFYLNKQDIINYGVKTANGFVTVLPERTEVRYGNLVFTLLNRITVVVNKNGSFVNMETSNIIDNQRDILNRTHGVLKSTIGKDKQNIEHVVFSVVLKQLEVTEYTDNITSNEVFDESIPLKDNYYMMQARMKLDDNDVAIKTTHSEELVDVNTLTMLIKDNDTHLDVRIPMIYQYSNFLSGTVSLTIFTTKGKVTMALENAEMSVTFPDQLNTLEEATIANVTVLAYTNTIIDGGINKRSFQEIKENIIYNSVGNITIPVTDYHLIETAKLRGFGINKTLDTLTERLYTVTKTLDSQEYSNGVISAPLFNLTVKTISADYMDSEDVIIDPNFTIIKPTAIFKVSKGVVTLLTKVEKDYFNLLPQVEQIDYINSNQLYFTPYYYKVDNHYNVINTEIYALDTPIIHSTNILNKNKKVSLNVNSNVYSIKRDSLGYKFGINLIGNSVFEKRSPREVKARIEILSGETKVFIDGTYLNDTTIVFNFETNLAIDNHHRIKILNGVSQIATKYVDLNSTVKLYLYVDGIVPLNGDNNNNSSPNNGFIQPEDIGLEDVTLITVEQYDIEFGKRLEYLWNKTLSSYTANKFVRHTVDKLLRYQKDILELDPMDGCPKLELLDEDECNTYNPIVKYHAGDVVKDGNNDDVYEYRAGDVVLTNGKPTINQLSGVVKYTDILAIDYKFKYSSAEIYTSFLTKLLLHINTWFELDLCALNKVTLDQTKIKYVPSRSVIKSRLSNGAFISPAIYPKLTVYIKSSDKNVLPDIKTLKNGIGEIFSNIFSYKNINMEDIRTAIKDKYQVIVGIRIDNVFNNEEAIKIEDGYSLPYLKTVMNRTEIISYDLEIIVEELDG